MPSQGQGGEEFHVILDALFPDEINSFSLLLAHHAALSITVSYNVGNHPLL
jgi:hypothetical protein